MAWRVCLVDDDLFVREALALGLRDAGFEVVAAPGAAAGLDLAERRPLDAIVVDLMMPGADGRALIREARSRWPHLVLIAISGAQRDAADEARAAGADAFLAKPLRPALLAQTLEEQFEARASVGAIATGTRRPD